MCFRPFRCFRPARHKLVILSEASRPHRDAQPKDPEAARVTKTARTFLTSNLPLHYEYLNRSARP